MKQRSKNMHSADDWDQSDTAQGRSEGEEIPMRPRPQQHYIEAQIQDGDTLQAIALRFRCTIAELKRINHLHKDNEIFAKRTIKVPISPYSVLTEISPGEPIPSTSQEALLHMNGHTSPAPNVTKSEEEIKEAILNSHIAPAVTPYTDTENLEQMTEDTNLLPDKRHITMEHVVVKQLTSQGADFGIKWYHLLVLVLILGVAAPVIYVTYLFNKHQQDEIDHPPLSDPH